MGKRKASVETDSTPAKRPAVEEKGDGSFQPPPDFVPLIFNGQNIQLPAGTRICLIRVPTEFDPRLLNGKTLKTEKGLLIEGAEKGQSYTLEATTSLQDSGMVVLTSARGTADLAARRDARIEYQYTVSRKYDIPPPGVGSYNKPTVTQPDNIKQRFTPFGSGIPVTTRPGVSESESRSVNDKKKSKKDKKEKVEASSAVADKKRDKAGESKKSKKEKKSKKSKKANHSSNDSDSD